MLPLRDLLPPRLPLELLLLLPVLCVLAGFRRRVPRLLLALHPLLRQRLARDLVCRCVRRRPVQLPVVRLTRLMDSPALLARNVPRLRLRPRLRGQLPVRRGLRALRQPAKDFRRRVHRRSPAKAIKGKDLARRKACAPRQLRVERLVPVVRRDRAVLRVPVVVLQEDFRNVPAAALVAAGQTKLPSGASDPAPRVESRKPSQASRSMRVNRPQRAGVRLSKNDLLKANAGCIPCARARARVPAARWSNPSRPFNANRAR